jgi:hypothetical protein
MSLSIYFTKPADTPIAASSAAFIEALERTAGGMAGIRVSRAPATADVVLIDERYQYRTWHYADDLAACAFVRSHAERICVINHDSYARPFLPGLYVSLEKSRPPFVDTRPIPYKWDLWKVPVPQSFEFKPSRLYAFRGTFHSHPIRKKMCRALAKTDAGVCEELRKAFHSHDETDQRRYIQEIRDARFSLCPRGLSPSSYRLYESMQLGRCPLIISDEWVAPSGPAWGECALFVRESDVNRLGAILAQQESDAAQRGRLAAEEWRASFCGQSRQLYLLQQVRLLSQQRKNLPYHELARLWGAKEFRRTYDWTLAGRAKQLLLRKARSITAKPLRS